MAETQTISLFIPLLFLVVMELSRLARGVDLKDTAEGEYSTFLLGFWPRAEEAFERLYSTPKLGRFNFIHGANFILLSLGSFLIEWLSSGRVALVLSMMVWIVWVLLPIFEVEEYDDVLEKIRPWSFLIHGVFATVIAVYIGLSSEFAEFIISTNISIFSRDADTWVALLYIMLVLEANNRFLRRLEAEIAELKPMEEQLVQSGEDDS